MRYLIAFCCLFSVGCSSTTELASLKSSLRISGETIVAKQDESLTILKENTTALAAIKSQIETLKASQSESETDNGIGGDSESDAPPQIETAANESLGSSPGSQPVAIEAVQLFVCSTASCAPCKRMWRDVDDGKLDGFVVSKAPPFEGLKSYPAIRFRDADSETGWSVVYGYDEDTRLWLRAKLLGEKMTASNRITCFPLRMSHGEMKALHDQLHGGNTSWTWPGGTTESLRTHLATTHGVSIAGGNEPVSGSFFQNNRTSAVTSQRFVVRSFPSRPGFFGGSRNTSRSACPTCPR